MAQSAGKKTIFNMSVKEFIKKTSWGGSGLKGMFLSFIFGTLPTGPLYIAFPIAAARFI